MFASTKKYETGLERKIRCDDDGNANLSGELQIDGVKVLGNRITGYGDFTNGSKTGFDATTATLPQVAAALAQVITDIKTSHGFLGS